MMTKKRTIVEKYDIEKNCVIISPVECFDVNKIFDCGQCFRFERVENTNHEIEFSGVAYGRIVSFAQDGDVLYIYNSDLDDYYLIWKHYLSLDRDYKLIEKDILSRSNNSALHDAFDHGRGIRILNGERWETLCSFIISQNNNIPRIKKIIEALCLACGNKIDIQNGFDIHLSGKSSLSSFPSPEAILSLGVDGLYELKTGFRAKYIYDAAQKVASGELDLDLIDKNVPLDQAIETLCQIKGVGPKVASCALLFAFEKYDAFPIDVWIKKVIAKYFISENMSGFSPEMLGEYAGIAQQFLFYYERYIHSK